MSVRAGEVRMVSFRRQPDAPAEAGLAQGEHIVPLADVPGFTNDIVQACQRAEEALNYISQTASPSDGLAPVAIGEVELCPPVDNPEKIICLGLNYHDHATEAGLESPPVPIFFSKFRNALTGHSTPSSCPGRARRSISRESWRLSSGRREST